MRRLLAIVATASLGSALCAGQSGALGGRFASQGMSRPLGGTAARSQHRSGGSRGTPYVAPYGYAWYTPAYAPPYIPQYDQPPVPFLPAPPQESVEAPHLPTDWQPPVDWQPPEEEYFLIAYKDHSVYPATRYWLEDQTLHYVTPKNSENQASLDLIDLDLTRTLNKGK